MEGEEDTFDTIKRRRYFFVLENIAAKEDTNLKRKRMNMGFGGNKPHLKGKWRQIRAFYGILKV